MGSDIASVMDDVEDTMTEEDSKKDEMKVQEESKEDEKEVQKETNDDSSDPVKLEENLYKERFGSRNEKVFEKLTKLWTR